MKDRKRVVKKRNILYLVENFLVDNGYRESAQCLRQEAKLNKEYVVCDNINLETILIEFETYYQQRFQTYPQLCKRLDKYEKKSSSLENLTSQNSPKKLKKLFKMKDHWSNKTIASEPGKELDLMVCSTSLMASPEKQRIPKQLDADGNYNKLNECYNEFISLVQDICIQNTNTRWGEVKGLENVKQILKEAVIYPIKYPNFFTGIIEPWKGVLLYGPPGTGKTSLAKALATESKATFFNVSASSIVNKWRGDSEKLIKVLFDTAHDRAPSIIFIDEIDALTMRRNGYEHEASRRFKSELFIAMDGLHEIKAHIFFLATTNTPWDLDEAMLRRFEKRIHVPLPNKETRKSLFQHYLPKVVHQTPKIESEVNYEHAAEVTEHFSGSDIKHMCKDLIMKAVREILSNLELKGIPSEKLSKQIITDEDFKTSVATFKPSVRHLVNKYWTWESEEEKQKNN